MNVLHIYIRNTDYYSALRRNEALRGQQQRNGHKNQYDEWKKLDIQKTTHVPI